MSIKSDARIVRVAEEHGMIEPFDAEQIKRRNGVSLISYGASRERGAL